MTQDKNCDFAGYQWGELCRFLLHLLPKVEFNSWRILLPSKQWMVSKNALPLPLTWLFPGSKVWTWPMCLTTVCRSTSSDRAAFCKRAGLLVQCPEMKKSGFRISKKWIFWNSEVRFPKLSETEVSRADTATERQKSNSLQCDPKLRLINWWPFNYFVRWSQVQNPTIIYPFTNPNAKN